MESGGDAYAAKPFAIMENEVASAAQLARGQKAEAVRLAKEAADIESTLVRAVRAARAHQAGAGVLRRGVAGRGQTRRSCRGVPAAVAANAQANALGGRTRASYCQSR